MATTSTTQPTLPPTIQLVEPTKPLPIESPGRLVVVDGDGEVVIVFPDGSSRTPVTSDGASVLHRQPTWAPGGKRLVFAELSDDGIWLTTTDDQGSLRRFVTEQPAFYFFWDRTGSRIGFLRNSASDGVIAFEVLEDADGASSQVEGLGSPFYFAWGPSGDDVAVHVGNGLIAVTDLGGGATEPLSVDNGPFAVPQWTSLGIAHVSEVNDGFELRLIEPGGESIAVARMPAIAQFGFSKNSRRVAVNVGEVEGALSVFQSSVPTLSAGTLSVLNLETQEVTELTREPVFGFFWSPDGLRLLALEVVEGEGARWRVWDVSTGGSQRYASFVPGPTFVGRLLPFFEQYALSWQLWAPDGSAFAYPATDGGNTAIWVQPVAGGPPTMVSSGSWVAWSDS